MRFRFRRILSLVLALAGSMTESALGVTIRFHTQVTVSSPFIYLKDVAEISDAAPETLAAYEQVKLAPSPPTGGQTYLDFEMIRSRIRAMGLSTSDLELTGKSRVHVITRNDTSAMSQPPAFPQQSALPNRQTGNSIGHINQIERTVEIAIRNALAAWLKPTELSQTEIVVRVSPEHVNHLLGTNAQDWNITGWSADLTQPQQLVFTPKTLSETGHSVPVSCEIHLPPMVLTVRQILPAGHVVEAADLEWVASNQTDAVVRADAAIGMETKRTLRPGLPIRVEDLRSKPYILTRDIVTVQSRHGGITVQQPMRALDDGGLGEIVRLVTLEGNQKFEARVTGHHRAEVLGTRNEFRPNK